MTRRKVVLLGLDGTRRREAFAENRMPGLAELARTGRLHDMTIEGPTVSGPSWSTLLTGTPVEQHGVVDNSFVGSRLARHPDWLSRAHYADQSITTFAAADWPPLIDPAGIGPVIFERREQQRAGQHKLVVRNGEERGCANTTPEVGDHAAMHLRDSGPDASFIYFGAVDEAGHLSGPLSDRYHRSCALVDELSMRLVTEIRARTARLDEDWLLVAVTDHGQIDAGGHGGDSPEEREAFVLTHGFGPGGSDRPEPDWPDHIRPVELSDLLLGWLLHRTV